MTQIRFEMKTSRFNVKNQIYLAPEIVLTSYLAFELKPETQSHFIVITHPFGRSVNRRSSLHHLIPSGQFNELD